MIIKRAFNNFFWLFVSEAISKGSIFLGTVYLARVLGKAGFGLYSLALAVGVYFWTVVDMGVIGYGTREVARDKEKAAELYSLLNSLRFILAISLFLIFCAALYIVDISPEKRLILLAGGFYVVGYSLSPDWVFRGLEKMQYITLGSLATSLVFLGGIYLFVKNTSGTLLSSIIYSLSFLVGSLSLMIPLYLKLKIPFSFRVSFIKWWLHIKESLYFAINGALNNISLFIPILFLGFWSTAEDLGTFSAPHRLTTMINRAGGLTILALYPVLSSLYVKDVENFKKTHIGFLKIIIWITVPICIIATFLSRDIMIFLFGITYEDSTGIFNIMIWLFFIFLLRYSFGNALVSAGFHRINVFATGIGATVVTTVSIVLIPKYSGYGAAVALMAGEIITLILMYAIFKQKVYSSKFLKSYFIKVLFAAISMGLVVKSMHLSAIPSSMIGIIIYGIISFIVGILNKKEIQRFKSLIT
jgi:O-antigen/teichoic acid export membrane protein